MSFDIKDCGKKILSSIKNTALFTYGCVSVIVNLSSIGLLTVGFPVYVALFSISIVALILCLVFHFVLKERISDMLKNNFETMKDDEIEEIKTIINDEIDKRSHLPDNASHYTGNRLSGRTQIVDIVI